MTTLKQIVINYLNKNYKIVNKRFYNVSQNQEERGFELLKLIETMFNLSRDKSKALLLEWASSFDLSEKEFKMVIQPEKLKVSWTQEMINDIIQNLNQ